MVIKFKCDFPEVYRRSRSGGLRESFAIGCNQAEREMIRDFLEWLRIENVVGMAASDDDFTFLIDNS